MTREERLARDREDGVVEVVSWEARLLWVDVDGEATKPTTRPVACRLLRRLDGGALALEVPELSATGEPREGLPLRWSAWTDQEVRLAQGLASLAADLRTLALVLWDGLVHRDAGPGAADALVGAGLAAEIRGGFILTDRARSLLGPDVAEIAPAEPTQEEAERELCAERQAQMAEHLARVDKETREHGGLPHGQDKH